MKTNSLNDLQSAEGDFKLYIVGMSLVAYLIFNRYEPSSLSALGLLLLGVPAVFNVIFNRFSSHLLYDVTTAYIIYWTWLLSFTVLYRLSPFHPLAKFPGPLFARVTKIWITGIILRGKAHLYYRTLHGQYGDVVRVGPNEISICNADAIHPVLGSKGLRKGPFYSIRAQSSDTKSLLNIADPVEHAVRRRTWKRALNGAALKDYEDILKSKVQQLMGCLAQRQNQAIDISEWMSFFGFDFMGRMAFGRDFDMMSTGSDKQGIWRTIEKGTRAFSAISHLPWLAMFLVILPQKSNPIAVLRRIGNDNAAWRIQEGSLQKDLFHHLMDEDGHELIKPTIPTVVSDGLLAILGGSDTTSTALCHLWYFLLRNPSIYERLRQEIDSVFPLGDDPLNFVKHVDMHYLNACLNEVLRLLPPILDGVQRTTAHYEVALFGTFVIPPHTALAVQTYSLHRDPRYFSPSPDTFWPDRWLIQEDYRLPTGHKIPAAQLVHNRGAFIPFSFGPANCVGKNLAIMELRAVTCSFIQKFDMSLADGCNLDDWEESILDYGVTTRGSLHIKLKSRR